MDAGTLPSVALEVKLLLNRPAGDVTFGEFKFSLFTRSPPQNDFANEKTALDTTEVTFSATADANEKDFGLFRDP